MYIITEAIGKKRFRAARTPSFPNKDSAQAYIDACPNAYTWKWQVKKI